MTAWKRVVQVGSSSRYQSGSRRRGKVVMQVPVRGGKLRQTVLASRRMIRMFNGAAQSSSARKT